MNIQSSDVESAGKPSVGSAYLGLLLDRHAVPPRERTKLIEELLGLAYHAAHRRVRGTHPMTLEEIERVAMHFGETLNDVLLTGIFGTALSGDFVCQALRLKCKFWLGKAVEQPRSGALVATERASGWVVLPAEDVSHGKVYDALQVVLETNASLGRAIAVLDDNVEVADSMCKALQQAGFAAEPFHAFEALSESVKIRPCDGYVLDWFVGKRTARELVAQIRQTDSSCPISIVTGQIDAGRGVPGDIADVVATYNVQYFEKPVTMSIVIATMSRLMGNRTPVRKHP